MLCPSCGHDNLPGADRCDVCMASLMKLDVPSAKSGLQERLMEDSIAVLNPSTAITIDVKSSASEALELMCAHDVGCVLVTDSGAIAGILTERDFLLKLAPTESGLDQIQVRTVMTESPVVLRLEDSIRFALHEMSVGGFRHIPVIGKDHPVRILSIRDVLGYLCCEVSKPEPDLATVASTGL
jgi:CBS domain-containing protein